MITNQKINVWDVEYSKLSHVLKFTVEANISAITTMEDICGRRDMTMDEIAEEMGNLLQQSILTHYNRGGLRRKYD